jgi:hypothetical protein
MLEELKYAFEEMRRAEANFKEMLRNSTKAHSYREVGEAIGMSHSNVYRMTHPQKKKVVKRKRKVPT